MSTDDATRRRKYLEKEKRCFTTENVVEQFVDYTSKSSIHGVQYVGDFSRPSYERLWWIFIFILSFLCNGYLIYKIYIKWRDSPVIVSFKETTTPVWEIPFPAVTICLQAKARRDQFNFKTFFGNTTDGIEKRSAMSLLCGNDVFEEEGSEFLEKSYLNFIVSVAPNVTESLHWCIFRNEEKKCSDYFKPVFTEDGLCFTFNSLNHSAMFKDKYTVNPYPINVVENKHWSLDKGYTMDAPINTYPHRGYDAGERAGLSLLLSTDLANHDPLCRGPVPGYKVLLHNPAEIPISSEKYLRVPVNQQVLVLASPSIMTTTPKLRSYSPSVRQCFYPDERQLRYFKIYTERNCEVECLTNYTRDTCGCVSAFMPRDEDTRLCGGGMKECTNLVSYSMRLEELRKMNEGINEDYCNCLPACTSIFYQAETSQAPFDWKKMLELDNSILSSSKNDTISKIVVFFTDTQFTTVYRGELFSVVDFLASCGGLLGLFSGISFISFLEIFYFLTLRFWGNTHQKNKGKPKTTEEENENMIET